MYGMTWSSVLERNAVTEFQVDLLVRRLVERGIDYDHALRIVVEFLTCENGVQQ